MCTQRFLKYLEFKTAQPEIDDNKLGIETCTRQTQLY
jgi:hypothetical protein